MKITIYTVSEKVSDTLLDSTKTDVYKCRTLNSVRVFGFLDYMKASFILK